MHPSQLWELSKPYILLGLASSLTGILVMFALGEQITSAGAALLAGYAWELNSTEVAKP